MFLGEAGKDTQRKTVQGAELQSWRGPFLTRGVSPVSPNIFCLYFTWFSLLKGRRIQEVGRGFRKRFGTSLQPPLRVCFLGMKSHVAMLVDSNTSSLATIMPEGGPFSTTLDRLPTSLNYQQDTLQIELVKIDFLQKATPQSRP